ncbi:MAG: hypothetical protein GF333_05690 [Candidatus Omnitrophica bacterium]|nr:hypothetical protein [Candidatus Omnitrophota bacterium]
MEVADDRTFFSYASASGKNMHVIEESWVPVPFSGDDLVAHFKENFNLFAAELQHKEKKHRLKIRRLFVNLPARFTRVSTVEHTVSFRREKKISIRDVLSAKQYVEESASEWGECCLHHVVERYWVNGGESFSPPVGTWSGKIRLRCRLIWVRNNVWAELNEIATHFHTRLGGVIAEEMSVLSSSGDASGILPEKAVLKIGYHDTVFLYWRKKKVISERRFPFGLRGIFCRMAERFSLSLPVAEQVFHRYFSLKPEVVRSSRRLGEVSVKSGDAYVNLSVGAVNRFLREVIHRELERILDECIPEIGGDRTSVTVTGRLNGREGWARFLREHFARPVLAASARESAAFGASRYGLFPCLDRETVPQKKFFRRISELYREYF